MKEIGWWIFFGIVAFITLIMLIKIKIIFAYDGTLALSVKVLFVKIRILPSDNDLLNSDEVSEKKKRRILKKIIKKKESKKKKALKKKIKKQRKLEKKKKTEVTKPPVKKKKPKGSLTRMIKMIIRVLKIFLIKFAGYLHVEAVRIKITVASDDAARTAILFGTVSQSVAYLLELLKKITNFKVHDYDEIWVRTDFLSEDFNADVSLKFSLRVWQVFALVFRAAVEYLKFMFTHPLEQPKPKEQAKPEQNNAQVHETEKNKTGKQENKKIRK